MMQRTRTTGPAGDLSPALILHLLPIQLLLFLANFGVLGRLRIGEYTLWQHADLDEDPIIFAFC